MTTTSVRRAPYTADGHLMHFPEDRYGPGSCVDGSWVRGEQIAPIWQPIEPFHATLTVTGMSRGRSAAYFQWTGGGRTFPMFMVDMLSLILATEIDHGTVSGRWIVCKRGQNYGIKLAATTDDVT